MSDCIGCGQKFDTCITDALCINCWREKAVIRGNQLSQATEALSAKEVERKRLLARVVELLKAKNKMSEQCDALKAVVEKLEDDELAKHIARDCHDPQHDERWCGTCEARGDGIEAYRAATREAAGKKGGRG